MAQRQIKTRRSISADTDGYDPNHFRKEIFLSYEQWQNLGESRLPWYEYNHGSDDRRRTTAVQRMIIPCVREIISYKLTARQREVLTMYLHHYTQVDIARKLGISQPTVNQHLNGKKRNGKKIGGSVKRIRKIIHRMSLHNGTHSDANVITILDQLLNAKSTRRQGDNLVRSLLR